MSRWFCAAFVFSVLLSPALAWGGEPEPPASSVDARPSEVRTDTNAEPSARGDASGVTGDTTNEAGKGAEEPGPEARREASERFRRGYRLYQDGEYDLALIEFERAYQIVPDYRVLYNVGQVAISLGRFARARQAFEEYLRAGADELSAPRREAVIRDLEMLRGRTAHLTVEGTPGAELFVDEVSYGVLPFAAPLLLDAGEHRVTVRKARYVTHSQRIALAGAEHLRLEIALERESEEPSVVIVREPKPLRPAALSGEGGGSGRGVDPVVVGWATTGVLVGGAIFTGVRGLSAANELRDLKQRRDPPREALENARERGQRWFLATDILAASAAVAAGVSLYLLLTREDRRSSETTQAAGDLELRAGTASVSLVGHF